MVALEPSLMCGGLVSLDRISMSIGVALNMDVIESISAFFQSIDSWKEAVGTPNFAYVAVRVGGHFEIAQARLWLGAAAPAAPLSHFDSLNIRAGNFLLTDLDTSPQDFLAAAVEGKIRTPVGELRFSGNASGQYSGYYQPFHSDGLQRSERIGVFTLFGGNLNLTALQPGIDWELKAAPEPYDSLQELMFHYRLGTLRADAVTIDVAALNVVVVDLSTVLTGTEAEIALRLSPAADPSKSALGYRVLNNGVVARGRIAGNDLRWATTTEGFLCGAATIQVPKASVIQCYASYSGSVQHQGWIADPTTAQNSRRAVYESLDPNLENLAELLAKQPGRGNARDLESGVAWLMWMLGFGVAHFGQTAKWQDAVDVLATTAEGHFAVIECTTGMLKTDNKLPLLVSRAEATRSRLDASNNQHLRVLPVIVTSRRRMEIRADLEQAERLGVLVITAEILKTAVDRTLLRADSDQIFREGEEAVQAALTKHDLQPRLPDL